MNTIFLNSPLNVKAGVLSKKLNLPSNAANVSHSPLPVLEESAFYGCKISIGPSVHSNSSSIRLNIPIRASFEANEMATIAVAAMAAAVLPLCWIYANKPTQRGNAMAIAQPGQLSLNLSQSNETASDSSSQMFNSIIQNSHNLTSVPLEVNQNLTHTEESGGSFEKIFQMTHEFSNLHNAAPQNSSSIHTESSSHALEHSRVEVMVSDESHVLLNQNDDLLLSNGVYTDPYFHSNSFEDLLHEDKKVIPMEIPEPNSQTNSHSSSISNTSLKLHDQPLPSNSSNEVFLSEEVNHSLNSAEPNFAENSSHFTPIHKNINGSKIDSPLLDSPSALDSNFNFHESSAISTKAVSNIESFAHNAKSDTQKVNTVNISQSKIEGLNSFDSLYNAKLKEVEVETNHSINNSNSLPIDGNEEAENYLPKYNRLIRMNRVEQSLILLENMNKKGILDTDKIYHGRFFEECIKIKNSKFAFRFLKLIRKPTLSSYNQLIKVCTAASDHESALKAFEYSKKSKLKPDTILYTSLISCLCKCGKLDEAFKYFHNMEREGVHPNLKTFGSLIHGCAKSKQVAKAFGVYGILISKKLKPDRVIFNSLISACSSSGSIDRAFDVLKDMEGIELNANHVTMGTIIDACVKNNQYEKALNLFYAIKEMKIKPNIQIYTASVNACAHAGDFAQASFIYECLKSDNVKPDEIFFSSLIRVSSKAQMIENAFDYLFEMKKFGIQASSITLNSLMSLCLEVGLPDRAIELYDMMKNRNIKITSTTFHILLKTLCNAKQLDTAISLLDDVQMQNHNHNHNHNYNYNEQQQHDAIDSKSYHLLISSCIQMQSVEKALKLYQRSQLEGIRTNLFTCECLIELCFDQIKKGSNPPLFFTPSNSFTLDSSILLPHQQWAACALSVYRNAISGGVIPTRKLVSKILGCFRVPPNLAKRTLLEGGFYVFGGIENDKNVRFSEVPVAAKPEEIYDSKALAIYTEASSMGVVPKVFPLPPKVINLENSYVHTAEVSILATLKAIQLSVSDDPNHKIFSVTLKFGNEKESSFLNSRNQVKSIKVSNRTSQACAALLRRLHIPFKGNSSSGIMTISSSSLNKYIQSSSKNKSSSSPSPLSSPLSLSYLPYPLDSSNSSPSSPSSPSSTSSSFSQRAKTLVQQQMAIRMNAAYDSPSPSPSPSPSTSHPLSPPYLHPHSNFLKQQQPSLQSNSNQIKNYQNGHEFAIRENRDNEVENEKKCDKDEKEKKMTPLSASKNSSRGLVFDYGVDDEDGLWLGVD